MTNELGGRMPVGTVHLGTAQGGTKSTSCAEDLGDVGTKLVK